MAMGRELKVSEPLQQKTLDCIEKWRKTDTLAEELSARQIWRDEVLVRLRTLVDR